MSAFPDSYSVTFTQPPNDSIYSLFSISGEAYHRIDTLCRGGPRGRPGGDDPPYELLQNDPRLDQRDPAVSDRVDLAQREHVVVRGQQRDPVPLLRLDAARGDRLAPANLPGLQRRELDPGEREGHAREGNRMGRCQPLGRGHRFETLEGHGVPDGEDADAAPAERLEVRAAGQLFAEVARDGANVGSRRARDRERHAAALDLSEGELRDLDLLGQRGARLPLARHLVELPA